MTSAASALLERALVWDNVWPWEPDFGNRLDRLPDFAAAGWTHVSLTVAGDNHNAGEALARIAAARRHILGDSRLTLATSVEAIRGAKRAGTLAVGLHLEGTRCFERNLDLIEAFSALGIRMALLAFNNANSVGGGCAEPDAGLTRFGRRAVAEMQRVGMLVDLSHTGAHTAADALEMASRPMVFSHSNVAEVTAHWRNLSRDQMMACAATGGLIGISGSSGYLGDQTASTEALFRHVDAAVGIVGIDHVGIGFDIVFDSAALNRWVRSRPDEWPGTEDADWPGFRYVGLAQLAELVERMQRAGYADGDIEKFLGLNYVRVCSAAWGEAA